MQPKDDGPQRQPTRYEPDIFGSLQREVDRLFNEFSRSGFGLGGRSRNALSPRIDVAETPTALEITAELPGLERGDVDLQIDEGTLTIRGEKSVESQSKDRNYRVMERAHGSFYRTIQLPTGVDTSGIRATMDNGVLKIEIPKPSRMQPQKIQVQPAMSGGAESGQRQAGEVRQGMSPQGTSQGISQGSTGTSARSGPQQPPPSEQRH